MRHDHRAEASRRQLLRDAAGTLAAVLLAYAAFDDITTDNDASFTFEWFALAVCAVWLLIVSWRLLRNRHWWIGSVSAVAFVAAVVAGSSIRPGASPQVEYLITIAGLLWFLGLAAILTGQAWWLGS